MNFTEDEIDKIIEHVTVIKEWIGQYEDDALVANCTWREAKQMVISMIGKLANHCVIGHPICFENDGAMLRDLLNELRQK